MTITAKVRQRAIDTGKVISLVQAQHQADTIVFQIQGEDAALGEYSFYLLYMRPSDTIPHVELLSDPVVTTEGYVCVSFSPHSYFTAEDGTVKIQLLGCEEADLTVDPNTGTISGSKLWESLQGFVFIHASQLNATETIIEENVLTEYLATFQSLKDEAATSAGTATSKAQEATGAAGTATTKAGQASDAKDAAAASALVAEGWAKGTQNNTPVGSSSPYHEKNAKYYADEAGEAAQTASGYVETTEGYKDSAETYASDAKEWAKGQRDDGGTVTHATDNASYYATQAGTAKDAAESAALVAEGYALGEQEGVPVTSGSPYYENNAEYFAGFAAEKASDASDFADKASDWAEKDTAVETGKYSAKYWAEFAADTTEDFVRHDDDASLLADTTPINADQLNGHTETYFAVKSESGASLELSVNHTNFVITANLKNKAGTTISSASIDLPNESAVTGITYNPTSKTLRFTYQSGQYTDVSIASLISALVTETTFNAHANNSTIHITGDERTAWNTHMSDTTVHVTSQNKSYWNAKYDKPSGGIPETDLAASVNTLLGYAENSITYVDTVSA